MTKSLEATGPALSLDSRCPALWYPMELPRRKRGTWVSMEPSNVSLPDRPLSMLEIELVIFRGGADILGTAEK